MKLKVTNNPIPTLRNKDSDWEQSELTISRGDLKNKKILMTIASLYDLDLEIELGNEYPAEVLIEIYKVADKVKAYTVDGKEGKWLVDLYSEIYPKHKGKLVKMAMKGQKILEVESWDTVTSVEIQGGF